MVSQSYFFNRMRIRIKPPTISQSVCGANAIILKGRRISGSAFSFEYWNTDVSSRRFLSPMQNTMQNPGHLPIHQKIDPYIHPPYTDIHMRTNPYLHP